MSAAGLLAAALVGAVSSAPADSFDVWLAAGRYRDAERAASAAVEEAEHAPGPDSVRVAEALARLLRARLRLARDGPEEHALAARVVAIRTRAHGARDPRVAAALNLHAALLWTSGRLDEARSTAERALALLEAAGRPDEEERARGLQVLANVEHDLGNHEDAATRWTEIHALRERLHGAESPEAAQALHSLGIATFRAGRHLDAMRIHRRALAIRERVLGPDHPDVAWTLINLANVHYDLGDYAEVIRLDRRALAIHERAVGPDHPNVALALNNLANAMERAGDPAGAVPLHERALAIRERARGPWHRDVAQSLNNLALALTGCGQIDRARALYERSIAIRDSALGPGSAEAARSRLRLGFLHLGAGAPELAERVLREAHQANLRELGPAHPASADAAITLACALLRLGRDDEGLDLALEAERATLAHLRTTAQGLDEALALTYAATRSSGLEVALTCAAAAPDDTARAGRVWDALARSRSVVLDEMIARRRWAGAAADTLARRRWAKVADARDRLARLALEGPATDSAAAARLDRAMQAKRDAERALAEHSLAFRAELSEATAGLGEIRAALPRDAALLAFAWYGRLPRGAEADTVPSVLALVLPPGGTAPRAVPLGPAAAIDRAAQAWLETLRRPPDALRRARDERACAEAGRRLRERVWDPVAPLLAGAARVFVVPEAALLVAPLAALPGRNGDPLLESAPLLHLVATERDLAAPRAAQPAGHGLLAVGGPAFDERGAAAAGLGPRASADPCAILTGAGFEPLPGAAAEAAAVARVWDATPAGGGPAERARLMTGAEARERALRDRAAGRRALHVAAHGFFLPERCPIGGDASAAGAASARRQPLLRAGLALAGANQRSAAREAADDGILTAEEIASLDLGSLDWVVLSACDTGLGELDINEGVLGLRRAFRAAGARALVMSLWRVDDAAAGEWMRALYEARFRRGLDGASAARAAAREVLRARRADGRSAHPYFWAGFAFEGDDRRP
jgi:CHAT domain-containing protein